MMMLTIKDDALCERIKEHAKAQNVTASILVETTVKRVDDVDLLKSVMGTDPDPRTWGGPVT